MKILMFGWEFPPHITGGLGTACFGLSQSLASLVERLVFVLPRVKGDTRSGAVEVLGACDLRHSGAAESKPVSHLLATALPFDLEIVDSALRPYQSNTEYLRHLRQLKVSKQQKIDGDAGAFSSLGSVLEISGDYGENLLDEVKRYAEMASRAVLREPFNVIHAHDWMTFLAGVRAKEMSGLPLVVHVHATEFDRCGDQIDQRIYEIERSGMERADRIVAVSQRTKDMIVTRYGIAADKIVVVHNGVAARQNEAPHRVRNDGEKVVVFLGRITMQKGPEYFLEAAYLVAQKEPKVRFVMAGSGDMLPQMIERMAELGILDRFHFTGFLNQQRRDELFAQADLFVLSSVSEPFGITPVEAMQHDIPVIVTKQSGVAEVVNAAIKVDFWDVRRMADAMINILKYPQLAREMALGGQRDLKSLTWDRAAAQIKNIYQELG